MPDQSPPRRFLRSPLAYGVTCVGLFMLSLLSAAASAQQVAPLATGPIIDLDFLNISGSTVPDRSGQANDGVGRKGAVGFETSWSPGTAADSQGSAAVVLDGTQMQRIAIPNR